MAQDSEFDRARWDRLWNLLSELSKQLNANRQQCEVLQKQAEDLKTQAVHTSTGFTLRRYNTDISQEQFDSELERMNATLVLENHALQHENKQLSMLVKDYEGTLESVMSRFRTFAHSTQQHDLALTRHYESLISSQQQQQPLSSSSFSSSHPLYENPLAVQASLYRLTDLLRKALRASQGEPISTSSDEDEEDEDSSKGGVMEVLELSQEGPMIGFGLPPSKEINARLGGFVNLLNKKLVKLEKEDQSKGGSMDEALARDVELERLQRENDLLREMLSIAKEPVG